MKARAFSSPRTKQSYRTLIDGSKAIRWLKGVSPLPENIRISRNNPVGRPLPRIEVLETRGALTWLINRRKSND